MWTSRDRIFPSDRLDPRWSAEGTLISRSNMRKHRLPQMSKTRAVPITNLYAQGPKNRHSPRTNIVRLLSHNLQFTQPARALEKVLHQLEFCMVKFCVGQMSRGQVGRARRLLPRLLSRLGLLSPMGPILNVISKSWRASPRASPGATKTYDIKGGG